MKELVSYIAKSLSLKPEDVTCEWDDKSNEVLRLRVDPSDVGRIIGKDGRIIRSIRLLLSAAAAKHRKKVNLILNEPPKP